MFTVTTAMTMDRWRSSAPDHRAVQTASPLQALVSSFTSPALYTDRLILTWPTPDQVQGFYDAIVGTRMFDTILWEGPASVGDLLEWWEVNRRRDFADPTVRLSLAVVEKHSGMCIGGAGLNLKADELTTVTLLHHGSEGSGRIRHGDYPGAWSTRPSPVEVLSVFSGPYL